MGDNKLQYYKCKMMAGFSEDVKMSSFKFTLFKHCLCFHNVKVSANLNMSILCYQVYRSRCVCQPNSCFESKQTLSFAIFFVYHLRHLLIIYAIYFHVLVLKHQIRPNVTC